LITLGCNDDEGISTEKEVTSKFFPLTLGLSNEYAITEITYADNGQKKDTLQYFSKDEIASISNNEQGQKIYIIDRFKRLNQNSTWQYDKSQRATIIENQVIVTNGALQFVKLQLPIEVGREWNGNQYFDDNIVVKIAGQSISFYKNWKSKYISLDQSMDINGRLYSDVLSIQLADHENRLEKRYGKEIYASDIGLIYREMIILDTQCFDDCQSTPWEGKAQKGQIFRQEYINSN
jgi:hypothetical protein